MTEQNAANCIVEWWLADHRSTPERLITLADHYAFQYRMDAGELHRLALQKLRRIRPEAFPS
jgi:hypothetical protein